MIPLKTYLMTKYIVINYLKNSIYNDAIIEEQNNIY